MNKIFSTIALALIAPLLLAMPAHAAKWTSDRGEHAKCVTKDELRSVAQGMTHAEAEKLLDGPGYKARLYDGARDYRPCGVAWEHGRVTVRYGKANRVWFAVKLVMRGGTLDLPIGHPRA